MRDLPRRLRARRPLVHAITNLVTMDWVARGLLAAGAAPVMAHAVEEADKVKGDALILNMGTWEPEIHRAMLAAGQDANRRGIPVVLDPVGVGGIANRLGAAQDILQTVRVTAIRGNAGEITTLGNPPTPGDDAPLVRGVDATDTDAQGALDAARALARHYRCIVATTGPVDVVTNGHQILEVRGGHPLMAQIPGTGCLGASLAAAALVVENSIESVATSMLWLKAAAEMAVGVPAPGGTIPGPGTFSIALLDGLAALETLPAGRIAPPLSQQLELYVIVSGSTPLEVVQAALDGGAGAIQWREKEMDLPQQVQVAEQVQQLCRTAGALFLVNDRVDLALALDADGCHVGQEDLPVELARKLLGPDRIIGASCETPQEAARAEAQGADYIGTGPIYATPSKADAGSPYGPDVIRQVTAATSLPVVGIGGIQPGSAAPVIEAGAIGVSVISAVTQAADPLAASKSLLQEVKLAKGGC